MRAALALLALLQVGAPGCSHCVDVSRSYVIDAPDPDLAALLQACMAAKHCTNSAGTYCTAPECIVACKRVAQLADDTAAQDSFVNCAVAPALDGGTTVHVSITSKSCGSVFD